MRDAVTLPTGCAPDGDRERQRRRMLAVDDLARVSLADSERDNASIQARFFRGRWWQGSDVIGKRAFDSEPFSASAIGGKFPVSRSFFDFATILNGRENKARGTVRLDFAEAGFGVLSEANFHETQVGCDYVIDAHAASAASTGKSSGKWGSIAFSVLSVGFQSSLSQPSSVFG